MALYRHNATGFLGEFAANPGAGYTAISAMPTDTVANRVTWWRGLDTYGQTSSWHPSVTRDAQDPGEATISIQFSQDIALISSEPDGTITNPRDPTNSWYIGATTEVRVYRGITDVTITEGWTLTKVEEGCTSTLTEAGGLYTLKLTDIPLLATNAGYVRITATRTGSGTFTKDFRFLKVFQGQDGADGAYVSYVFKASATAPSTPTGTNPIPSGWLDSPPVSSDPVWMSKATISGGIAGSWSTPVKVTAVDGSDGSFTTYQYAKNSSFTTAPTTGWADTPYSLSTGEFQWMRTKTTDPNTGAVSYGVAYRVTGEKGADGANGSSGTVIDLSNEAHTVPTDADGNNGVYTGATTTASLFIGGTDDSANWTWTATPSSGVTGTATNSNRTYTVSGMSVDVGTVTFTANKTGEAQRTAVFTISKAKGGVAYSLDVSAGSISKSQSGVYNPSSLTLTATKITTSGVTSYSGMLRIQTQATLGGVWTTVYSSASAETTTTYSVPANIVAIKAMLYLAGGFTSLLDQESVPVVFDGQDGASAYVLDLDNENQTVAAAKDGAWISGTQALSNATVYLGSTSDGGWTYSWSPAPNASGVNYFLANDNRTIVVTDMKPPGLTSTNLTCTATKGSQSLSSVFTVSKANAGIDGTPATVYWLQTSASAIGKDAAGTYNPTSFTVNAYSQTGTNAVAAYTGRFVIQTQATLNGSWTTRYTSAGNESSKSYDVPASIVAIRVYLYQAGGTTTLLDQETLPVVADGQPGTPGTPGERGSRQIVITGTSDWSDATAWNGLITRYENVVLSDLVTIVNTANGTSTSKFCTDNTASPGSWTTVTEYINGNLLVTGTVGANAIAANAITAGKIAAAAITADKLAIGTSGKNLISNSGPTRGAETSDWSVGYYTCSPAPTVGAGFDPWRPPGGASVVISMSGTLTTSQQMEMNNLRNAEMYPVVSGNRYEVSAYLSAHRCKGYVQINWYNDATTLISTSTGSEVTSAGSGSLANWGRSTLFVTAPPTASKAMFICKAIGTGGSSPYLFAVNAYFGAATSSQSVFSDWSPSGGGTTLIDGAGIRANTITADRLVAGTITADSAAVASLSASKITTGTLNANAVSVTNLNADNITGGSLNVARISAQSITGSKIAIGNDGIGTGNVVPGAVSWAISHSEEGYVTPPFGAWAVVTYLSVPTNNYRGKMAINICMSAKYAASMDYFVNLRISRPEVGGVPAWSAIAAMDGRGCIEAITLSVTDPSPPTTGFTYTLERWYARRVGTESATLYRVIGGSILELKR